MQAHAAKEPINAPAAPFGGDAAVAAALARCALDPSVHGVLHSVQPALAAYLSLQDDLAWGATFAPVATGALAGAPAAGSAARVAAALAGSPRCTQLRQAVAAAALGRLHDVQVRQSAVPRHGVK